MREKPSAFLLTIYLLVIGKIKLCTYVVCLLFFTRIYSKYGIKWAKINNTCE